MSKRPLNIYGKNSVLERLRANPKSIRKIFLKDDFNHSEIEKLIKLNRVSSQSLSPARLQKLKSAASLGGIIAEVEDFSYAYLEDLIDQPKESNLSLIFLDRIFDPQNLGAIIRTAACFGKFAIVIPKHKACEITDTVLHVASGGENYVPVAMVSNLSNALLSAKSAGFWAVGTASESGENLSQAQIPMPTCLVIGSEGSGIRYGLTKHLDSILNIPMPGVGLSFNVTAACAIFCYELTRQKLKP